MKMSSEDLFGEVVSLSDKAGFQQGPGCDDVNCPGYQDCNQCNPDDD